jgi:hypothetical protein
VAIDPGSGDVVTTTPVGVDPQSVAVGDDGVSMPVDALAEAYHETIPRIMSRSASAQDVALASDSQV